MKAFHVDKIPESSWQIDFDKQSRGHFEGLDNYTQKQILEHLQRKIVPYLNLQRRYSHRYVNEAFWPFTYNGYRVSCNLDYKRRTAYIFDVEP